MSQQIKIHQKCICRYKKEREIARKAITLNGAGKGQRTKKRQLATPDCDSKHEQENILEILKLSRDEKLAKPHTDNPKGKLNINNENTTTLTSKGEQRNSILSCKQGTGNKLFDNPNNKPMYKTTGDNHVSANVLNNATNGVHNNNNGGNHSVGIRKPTTILQSCTPTINNANNNNKQPPTKLKRRWLQAALEQSAEIATTTCDNHNSISFNNNNGYGLPNSAAFSGNFSDARQLSSNSNIHRHENTFRPTSIVGSEFQTKRNNYENNFNSTRDDQLVSSTQNGKLYSRDEHNTNQVGRPSVLVMAPSNPVVMSSHVIMGTSTNSNMRSYSNYNVM